MESQRVGHNWATNTFTFIFWKHSQQDSDRLDVGCGNWSQDKCFGLKSGGKKGPPERMRRWEEKPMWMEDQESSSGNVELKAPGTHLVFFFFILSFLPPSFLSPFLSSSTSFPPFLSLSFLLFLCLTFHNIKLRKTYWIYIEYSLFHFSNFKIFICKRKKKEIRNEYSSFWVGTLFY